MDGDLTHVSQAAAGTAYDVVFRRDSSGSPPLVTVTISLFNDERHIIESLESVRHQRTGDLDLIVVDDGSQDRSVELAREWMSVHWPRFRRCQLLRHRVNRGLATSRNLAFSEAESRYVLVLDAYSVIYPRCIDALSGALDHCDASFSYGYLETVGGERGMRSWRPWNPAELHGDNYIDPPALIRRSAWDSVGGYSGDMGVPGSEDHDLWLKIAARGGWGVLVPEFLARYREEPAGKGAATGVALADAERALRFLRADLDLQEWQSRGLREREAEANRMALEQARTHPDRILGEMVGRAVGRVAPAGTLRRRVARRVWQAALILATDGPRALVRRGGGFLKRRSISAWSAGISRLARRAARQSSRARATSADSLGAPEDSAWPAANCVYRPHVEPTGRRVRVALLASSLGNYYFNGIRDLIAAGMTELGCEVETGTDDRGLREDVDWNVIVAPHEFFWLGRGPELLRSRWPDNVIIMSSEQPSTIWFAHTMECLPRAKAVWDIDFGTSRFLRERGLPCDYLPLGYVPGYSEFGRVAELPLHYGTCFLGDPIRRSPSAGGALSERPLDILFVGAQTPRREAFFSRAAPTLTDYHSYLHIFRTGVQLREGKTTYIDGPTVNGLSQRSKILLNIHRGEDVYFEWQRIVLQGLWHRTLVVTERCTVAPPFRAGIDYVEADLDQIPRVLRYYLDDEQGRREAQEIADSGHRTLVSECRMSSFLETLLTRHAASGAVLNHFESIRSRPAPLSLLAP